MLLGSTSIAARTNLWLHGKQPASASPFLLITVVSFNAEYTKVIHRATELSFAWKRDHWV